MVILSRKPEHNLSSGVLCVLCVVSQNYTISPLYHCALINSLKQAALSWWKELAKSMKKLGFKHLASDAGLFVYKMKTDLVVAVVYVDDAMFFGKNKTLVIRRSRNSWMHGNVVILAKYRNFCKCASKDLSGSSSLS